MDAPEGGITRLWILIDALSGWKAFLLIHELFMLAHYVCVTIPILLGLKTTGIDFDLLTVLMLSKQEFGIAHVFFLFFYFCSIFIILNISSISFFLFFNGLLKIIEYTIVKFWTLIYFYIDHRNKLINNFSRNHSCSVKFTKTLIKL